MTSRDLIVLADQIRKEQGMTATSWGIAAGYDDGGTMVGRTFRKGNCKVSTLVQLLRPLGYELEIRKVDEMA